jgi:hypothetical protein
VWKKTKFVSQILILMTIRKFVVQILTLMVMISCMLCQRLRRKVCWILHVVERLVMIYMILLL